MTDQTDALRMRDRSPSYPFIPLSTAIERLEAFEKTFGRHPTPKHKAGIAWGMKEGSSQANQTLAALKAFGLLESDGASRKISDDGRTYLRAEQDDIKRRVLREAALKPKKLAEFWTKWKADRPHNEVCLDELRLKGGFTDDAASNFLLVYDETIAYAGLSDSDKIPPVDDTEHKEDDDLNLQRVTPKVGDYVQWTSGGSDQFRIPRCVTWISDDGSHARVHGSLTGIKMNELTVVDPPAPPPVGLAGKSETPVSDSHDDAPDINIFLTGKRLQITADVDAQGIITLKKMLDQFEDALKLLSQPIQNFKRPEPDTSSDETE